MPELPDVVLFVNSLDRLLRGQTIRGIHVRSPFVLRTFDISLDEMVGRSIVEFSRLGKRIIWHVTDDYFLIFHLMISGRFHWQKSSSKANRKMDLMSFNFDHGSLAFTEAASKKRAGLWVVHGRDAMTALDPGGADVFRISLSDFAGILGHRNNTLKRALTDPHRFDGIGNAYSDEILHAAKLSPLRLTSQLSSDEIRQLYEATRRTLTTWIDRLNDQANQQFPDKGNRLSS